MISRVSFEGERGTGKTSTISSLREILINQSVPFSLNRELDTGKKESPHHQQSLEAHELWLTQFDTQGHPINSSQAEDYSHAKFIHALAELHRETDFINRLTLQEPLVCDRDLDTIVTYAAVELSLSNPDQPLNPGIITNLWRQVLEIRPPADLTFCLVTNSPQETLNRSYLTKQSTQAEFSLTEIQKRSQQLASELLPQVVEIRQKLFPGSRVISINTDGKRPDEISKLASNHILYELTPYPDNSPYPVLPLIASPEQLKSFTIDDLATCIFNSSTGAAFPSSQEINIGFSNCVYSNLSLIKWSNTLGLKEPLFVAMTHDPFTQTNPVHWVTLDTNKSHSLARIIDTTPFNSSVKFGPFNPLQRTPEGYRLSSSKNELLYTDVSPANPEHIHQLMQLAHISQTRPQDPESLKIAHNLYALSSNEQEKVFSGIRLIRIYEFQDNENSIIAIANNLSDLYPNNLVLAREIARLIQTKKLPQTPEHETFLQKAANNIKLAQINMSPDEYNRFYSYYQSIIDLCA